MFLKLCGNKIPREEPGNDNKSVIRVGKAFQASVPDSLIDSKDDAYPVEDKLLWDPTVLSQDVTEKYLKSIGCRDASDQERALWLLHRCSYNTTEAMLRSSPFRCSTELDIWSEFERNCFLKGIKKHGKNFHSIQKLIRSKSVEETVSFYYYWKMMRKRCRRFSGHPNSQNS